MKQTIMNIFSMRIGRRDQEHNRGFTLVELIVVISIMSVMIGIASLGISLMFSRDAQSVATKIDDELSEVRMLTMTRADSYKMIIHTTSDFSKDNTIIIEKNGTREPAITLDKSVKITAEQKNGSGGFSFSSGEDIEIVFDKGNGSISKVDGVDADGVYVISVAGGAGGSKVSTVSIISITGRHYVE